MSGFRWTEARIERLIELWNAGHSLGEIAPEFGVSRAACSGALMRLRNRGDQRVKRPVDKKRAHRAGVLTRRNDIEAIALQKNADQQSLYILQRREDDGASFHKIGDELGLSGTTVKQEYNRIIKALDASEAR